MSAQLIPIHAGPSPAIPVARPVILVGRHPDCDCRIDVPQVSRRHCCLAMAYDRLVIPHLGDWIARWQQINHFSGAAAFDVRGLSYFTFGLALYLTVLLRARRSANI